MKQRKYRQNCTFSNALDVIGERWTLLIIRDLLAGPRRFKDLVDGLPGAGTNLISARLKELVSHGLLRLEETQQGVKLYRLTAFGEELRGTVTGLARWGLQFRKKPRKSDFWSPWWNPVALSARFDSKLAQGLDFVTHLQIGDLKTEVIIQGAKFCSSNEARREPQLTIAGSAEDFAIALNSKAPKRALLRRVSIKGDRGLAKQFLDCFDF